MSKTPRFPTVYIPHGGGPWPFMPSKQPAAQDGYAGLTAYLRALPAILPSLPRAILVISAHWEAPLPTVLSAPAPPMLYDYFGFPKETYEINWPAPGDPALAERVQSLLRGAGIPSASDPKRGFDHGTFVPLGVTYPNPKIPTIQLSLKQGLDPRAHLEIGRALEPLRAEGVFILGSGMSYHNMRGFFGGIPSAREDAQLFDEWLGETVAASQQERDLGLAKWETAPRARMSHPREEHLLPLMVVAGAAGEDRGRVTYREELIGEAMVSGVQFG